jgi:4-hydroxy-tetrahydrodipicolinate reductase
MKAVLLGYGQMGREIEQILLGRGDSVLACISRSNRDLLPELLSQKPDVVFEFSSPESAAENIRQCLSAGVKVVCGSTGWYASLPEMEALCRKHEGSLFYAPNFSIGVYVFMQAAARLAALLGSNDSYDCGITEIHHLRKKDAPSGTAIRLAETILPEIPRYSGWKSGEGMSGDHLIINAKREDEVPGTHILEWDSAVDGIRLEHLAKGRKGFATGAVEAAYWIQGREGIFTMSDMLGNFNHNK